MSISTYRKLLAEADAPNGRIGVYKQGVSVIATQSSWRFSATLPGAVPTTPAVPTNLTVGALGQQNGGAAALRMVAANLQMTGGIIWVADRLSHQGGLSGTAAGAQTTNLPTAALTRYTSGEGVLITAEIYTLIGATVASISANYTNSAGTPGRITPPIPFGGTNAREVSRAFILPFQQGDTGARSVESVTVSATTGTVGDFGITLAKPLVPLVAPTLQPLGQQQDAFVYLGGFMPEIVDDACLYFIVNPGAATPQFTGDLRFAEDT